MAQKRTKLEVIRDMLEVLKNKEKVKVTHLIYKANLSNNSIKPHLQKLKESEMVIETQDKTSRYFTITAKGEEFLREFNKIRIISEAYGLS